MLVSEDSVQEVSFFQHVGVPGNGLWLTGLAARAFTCRAILSVVLDGFRLCIWNNILLLFLLLCFSYLFLKITHFYFMYICFLSV